MINLSLVLLTLFLISIVFHSSLATEVCEQEISKSRPVCLRGSKENHSSVHSSVVASTPIEKADSNENIKIGRNMISRALTTTDGDPFYDNYIFYTSTKGSYSIDNNNPTGQPLQPQDNSNGDISPSIKGLGWYYAPLFPVSSPAPAPLPQYIYIYNNGLTPAPFSPTTPPTPTPGFTTPISSTVNPFGAATPITSGSLSGSTLRNIWAIVTFYDPITPAFQLGYKTTVTTFVPCGETAFTIPAQSCFASFGCTPPLGTSPYSTTGTFLVYIGDPAGVASVHPEITSRIQLSNVVTLPTGPGCAVGSALRVDYIFVKRAFKPVVSGITTPTPVPTPIPFADTPSFLVQGVGYTLSSSPTPVPNPYTVGDAPWGDYRLLFDLQQPSSQPTSQPSSQPTSQPFAQPTSQPSSEPTSQPTSQPSSEPSSQPTSQPTSQPSSQPTSQPTSQPSSQPSSQPTSKPTKKGKDKGKGKGKGGKRSLFQRRK